MTLAERLSGLVDAMRNEARADAVRAELRLCFDLAGLRYSSLAPQPPREAWRTEWNAIAREIAQEHASAAVDGPRANLARARLRRWDHHTSVVDLTWERDL